LPVAQAKRLVAQSEKVKRASKSHRAGFSWRRHQPAGNYVTETQHRIEIYRKLAQATENPRSMPCRKNCRPFGPLPHGGTAAGRGELKILASEKAVTAIEVEEDKLKITRHTISSRSAANFRASPKKEAKARSRNQAPVAGDLNAYYRLAKRCPTWGNMIQNLQVSKR